MRLVCPAIGLALLAAPSLAGPPPVSGQYGSLTLAVVDGAVSGVFSERRMGNGTATAPQFTCVFQLRGRLRGERARIETWYPGGATIPGELVLVDGKAFLTLEGNQDGCLTTSGDMVRQPFEIGLSRAARGWIGVGLVESPRAAFHPAPGASTPRAPYVVASDAVAVLERRGGWVRASFLGGRRPVTGWLRAADLAPNAPPGRP